MQRTILVVEQDEELRQGIVSKLEADGYATLALADSTSTLRAAQAHRPALIVFDVMLLQPKELEICRQLRVHSETGSIPVLMLVPGEGEIAWLERSGIRANDYIIKPLLWPELQACVHTLLRSGRHRTKPKVVHKSFTGQVMVQDSGQVLTAYNLSIDVDRRQVMRGNQLIELQQPLLFNLLLFLVRHRGVALTRDQLLKQVWGYEQAYDSRTIDVHIRLLRKKLEDDPANPQLIQTVRGVGYRFQN
ncbi:MAG: response regulator transcription factor [Ktedonobacteraceae bacterium]